MYRISLRYGPGSNFGTAQPVAPATTVLPFSPYSSATPVMNLPMADSIFRSQDDVELAPPSGNFPPVQRYALSPTNVATRRQSTGDYSWLATITPNQGDSKSAMVSVVVFYKRNLNLGGATAMAVPPERMVSLAAAAGSTGLGGGDVILSCPATDGSGNTMSSDYLKVKPNQWILLSQTPAPPGFWRWYKVLATTDAVSNGTIWRRQVTLAGPDWNTSIPASFASIFDGVVGVYERAIELEELGGVFSPN